jgi:hypothetical protein
VIYLAPLVVALAVLLVIDWRQTLVIARNPLLWYERNPLLGKHPSPTKVHAYFAASCAFLAGAVYLLPQDCALVIVAVAAVCEVVCVANNYRHGIKP